MHWSAYIFIGVAGAAMALAKPTELEAHASSNSVPQYVYSHAPQQYHGETYNSHENGAVYNPNQRQQFVQDSYLEALEYSHNSASIQGTDGPTGLGAFFRTSTFINPDGGLTRTGMATAIGFPLAAIAGLALLAAPIAVGRRRRDLSEPATPGYMDAISARLQTLYGQVLESEECMERLVCELGSMAKNISHKESLIGVAAAFTPDTYKKHMSTFKMAAHTGDATKCRKIKCTPIGL